MFGLMLASKIKMLFVRGYTHRSSRTVRNKVDTLISVTSRTFDPMEASGVLLFQGLTILVTVSFLWTYKSPEFYPEGGIGQNSRYGLKF
jgi:hypothetical protein